MMWTYQNKNICLCYIRLDKSEIVVLIFYMTKKKNHNRATRWQAEKLNTEEAEFVGPISSQSSCKDVLGSLPKCLWATAIDASQH